MRTCRVAKAIVAGTCLFAAAAPAMAQADDCANATVITAGIYQGTTQDASRDGTGSCDFLPSGPDVWYLFTPPFTGSLRVDTCAGATFDTIISIHSGCPGDISNEIACSDDSCEHSASAVLNVTAGQLCYIRVAGFNGQRGDFTLTVRLSVGEADALAGDLATVTQFSRLDDTVACSADSPLCNAGNNPLDTMGNPDPRHPFFTWNVYRIDQAGSLRQIGRSWVKHMLGAGQGEGCGLSCNPNPDFLHLGVGCSDTYSASFNANQSLYGPRSEVNGFTGAFTYAGSVIEQGVPPTTPVDRLIRLRDADIDPAQNAGASYFCEFVVVCHDDNHHENNICRRQLTFSGAAGGTYTISTSLSSTVGGPAIAAWPGATLTTLQTPGSPAPDGRCILAAKVTDNGNGTWHYEYALFNHDLGRGVRSLTIPIGSTTTISSVTFWSPRADGEGVSNAPWTNSRQGSLLTWSTDPFEVNQAANALRWASTYSFAFDADRAPVASNATLGLFEPGAPDVLSGVVQSPAAPCRADWNGDGIVEPSDVASFVQSWFAGATGGTMAGDFDGNGTTEPADVALFVQTWFAAVSGGC